MPKGWPEVCREAEGRKWSAGQLATNRSQSEVGCRGWGWLSGGGICSHSKFAIYNQGTAFVGQSPLRNPHQKHKVSEIFLGLASWCDPQNSVGEQWEKTPSFPPVVPGRLFSVSSTWLQVEIPKWIWLKHLHLGHLKTSTLLTQQSSGLRNSQPAPAWKTHDILHNPVLIWITGWGRRGGGGGGYVCDILGVGCRSEGTQPRLCFIAPAFWSCAVRFCLMAHPAIGILVVGIFKTLHTEAGNILL